MKPFYADLLKARVAGVPSTHYAVGRLFERAGLVKFYTPRKFSNLTSIAFPEKWEPSRVILGGLEEVPSASKWNPDHLSAFNLFPTFERVTPAFPVKEVSLDEAFAPQYRAALDKLQRAIPPHQTRADQIVRSQAFLDELFNLPGKLRWGMAEAARLAAQPTQQETTNLSLALLALAGLHDEESNLYVSPTPRIEVDIGFRGAKLVATPDAAAFTMHNLFQPTIYHVITESKRYGEGPGKRPRGKFQMFAECLAAAMSNAATLGGGRDISITNMIVLNRFVTFYVTHFPESYLAAIKSGDALPSEVPVAAFYPAYPFTATSGYDALKPTDLARIVQLLGSLKRSVLEGRGCLSGVDVKMIVNAPAALQITNSRGAFRLQASSQNPALADGK